MTQDQIEMAKALGRVTMIPGVPAKAFVRNMADIAEHRPEHPISEAQAIYLRALAWRFRRQMPSRLVPAEKPS